jgi:hypothetical protein
MVEKNSDRGLQYACGDYTDLLEAYDIRSSMSRIGCFMKTLKQEEVDGRAYRDIDHARSAIGAFLDDVYNRHRLHSALCLSTARRVRGKLAADWSCRSAAPIGGSSNLSPLSVSHRRVHPSRFLARRVNPAGRPGEETASSAHMPGIFTLIL